MQSHQQSTHSVNNWINVRLKKHPYNIPLLFQSVPRQLCPVWLNGRAEKQVTNRNPRRLRSCRRYLLPPIQQARQEEVVLEGLPRRAHVVHIQPSLLCTH